MLAFIFMGFLFFLGYGFSGASWFKIDIIYFAIDPICSPGFLNFWSQVKYQPLASSYDHSQCLDMLAA